MSSSSDQFDSYSTVYGEAHLFADGHVGSDSFSNFYSDNYPPIHVSDPVYFSPETNGNDPILPPPTEMEPEEGYALREWRRQNAIRIEGKENKEKELLNQIIVEADEYKVAFNQKRLLSCETNKAANRENEKVFVASQDKFHAEADKDYWKSIADLIPKEVPTIEKRKSKKDQEKKPSVLVVQGPKPGKPTDLARMRQVLLKLKHNTPTHLKPSPPLDAENDTKAAVPAVAVA